MTLFELFLQHGDPTKTYSDELVAGFYQLVDDGSMFGEALAEMSDHERERVTDLIFDRTSRTLSHQMVGKIVVDQLRSYAQAYLRKNFESLEPEIREYKKVEARDFAAENAGDATGCHP